MSGEEFLSSVLAGVCESHAVRLRSFELLPSN